MKPLFVIFSIVFVLTACTPAPAAPTAVLPPTRPTAIETATPEPTEAVPTLKEFPPAACCRGESLSAGTYRLPSWLGLGLSIEVPSGWRVIHEDVVNVFSLARGKNNLGDVAEWLAFFVLEEDEPAEQFQQDLLAMDGFTFGEPVEVTIAGFSGWQVDAQALPNPDFDGEPEAGIPPGTQILPVIEDYFVGGFNWTTSTIESRIRIIYLATDGAGLVVYFEAPQSNFDASVLEAMQILDTLGPID